MILYISGVRLENWESGLNVGVFAIVSETMSLVTILDSHAVEETGGSSGTGEALGTCVLTFLT